MDKKLCTAAEAAGLIQDGQVVVSGGFVGAAHPEALTSALERRFLDTGLPRNLTLVYAAGQGDGSTRGANHFAHEGLVKRVIGGHWGLAPKLGELATKNLIEAYNFPQGVICQIFRDIAAGRPGCITHIGLETFIDPENSGGRINDRTREPLVERIKLGGRDWLWYKAFPVDIGLIRGTAADTFGNIVMYDEAIIGEVLPIAQAAHNSGGKVIAQVKKILDRPAPPQSVGVPGILVDHIVIAEAGEHQQTFAEQYNRGYCSALPDDESDRAVVEKMEMGPRRIIAARALMEIKENAIANLGIGIPEDIGRIAAEYGVLDSFTLTVESGPIGGIPAGGWSFGASLYPEAIIDQPAQFDFYDGRGLDFAALGAAEIDSCGNVNVSKFGKKLPGVGGFVNITQTAKKLVFCSPMTAGGLEISCSNNNLIIKKEGKVRKFVERVEQVSFSSSLSQKVGQEVIYVTERAVFRLTKKGLELIEIAPGIDIKRQVLDVMGFKPIVGDVKLMPEEIFTKGG
ncbi:MAG: acyl CoA:acetate/3-ketoacid CoA transferase [Actinobacteria bacterium]|nr:acyl CoA:acetate/3-ketoacid CoA transferase [Actinomycetota bacterium]